MTALSIAFAFVAFICAGLAFIAPRQTGDGRIYLLCLGLMALATSLLLRLAT